MQMMVRHLSGSFSAHMQGVACQHLLEPMGASPLLLEQDSSVGLAACRFDLGYDATKDDNPCRQQSMISRCDKLAYCIFTFIIVEGRP